MPLFIRGESCRSSITCQVCVTCDTCAACACCDSCTSCASVQNNPCYLCFSCQNNCRWMPFSSNTQLFQEPKTLSDYWKYNNLQHPNHWLSMPQSLSIYFYLLNQEGLFMDRLHHVTWFNTSRCNLDCEYCFTSLMKNTFKRHLIMRLERP